MFFLYLVFNSKPPKLWLIKKKIILDSFKIKLMKLKKNLNLNARKNSKMINNIWIEVILLYIIIIYIIIYNDYYNDYIYYYYILLYINLYIYKFNNIKLY